MEIVDQLTTDKVKVVVVDKYEDISQRLDVIENSFIKDSGKLSPEEKFLIENASPETLAQLYGLDPSELKKKKSN